MTRFNVSYPNTTKFNSSISYKGIPKYNNGNEINRSTRLAIAKEIQRLRDNENKYDIVKYNNMTNQLEIIESFKSKDNALLFLTNNPDKELKLLSRENNYE